MKYILNFVVIISVAFAGPLKTFKGKRLFGPMQERIIGGVQANEGEFPYLVSLQYFGSHFCGGAILNNDFILTAAQCLNGKITPLVVVVAGAHNQASTTEPSQQRIQAFQFFTHPEWNPDKIDGDFGIIKLLKSLSFGDGRVAPLPGITVQEVLEQTSAINMGWGYTSNENPSISLYPHKVLIQTWSRFECKIAYEVINPITERMICASGNKNGPPAGSCTYDSGSPLMCFSEGGLKCCGVVSWGMKDKCGDPEYPTVFGNVAYASGWIKSTANMG